MVQSLSPVVAGRFCPSLCRTLGGIVCIYTQMDNSLVYLWKRCIIEVEISNSGGVSDDVSDSIRNCRLWLISFLSLLWAGNWFTPKTFPRMRAGLAWPLLYRIIDILTRVLCPNVPTQTWLFFFPPLAARLAHSANRGYINPQSLHNVRSRVPTSSHTLLLSDHEKHKIANK